MSRSKSAAVTLHQVRSRLGIALVSSHFVAFVSLVALTSLDRFTFSELITTVAVITPLFAAYTTAIVRFFLANEASRDGATRVAPTTFFLTWLIAGLYVVLVLLAVSWKGFGSLIFDDFVKLLGLVEATFAVYTGIVVQRYFGATQVSA